MVRRLSVTVERWPIAGEFRLSRGAKTEAVVVVVRLRQGGDEGWGEGVPYGHYGECVAGTVAAIEGLRAALEKGLGRDGLLQALPAGAARNAVDCALWDLEAQRVGEPVWQLAGLPPPQPLPATFTITLATAEEMAACAAQHRDKALLKVKLGADGVVEKLRAIHAAAPEVALLVDANEGWSGLQLRRWLPALAELGVVAVEQPLAAGADALLAALPRQLPICADESFRDIAKLARLRARYDMVNIKLDKCGGLTAAVAQARAAARAGLQLMVGCMVSTSLSLAPAMLLAADAALVDLDAGLLLSRDRAGGVVYRGGCMLPSPLLWGLPRSHGLKK